MADVFKAQLMARVGWTWTADGDNPVDKDDVEFNKNLLDGNAANQAEAKWSADSETLLNGTSTTLDLTALERTVFGDTLTITLLLVKAILIVNESTSGGQLIVGGAASDEWSEPFGADGDQVLVPLDSPMLLVNRRCGWEVDDNNKNLKIAASGGDVTYSMAIVGTTTVTSGECSSSGL